MLEIPESRSMAEQLTNTVKGKRVQNVYAASSAHKFAFFSGEPDSYHTMLCKRSIDAVHAIGGQVELHLGDKRLLFADGVNIRFFDAGEPLPKKHQLHIEFNDFSSVICTVQMYGGIWLFQEGENDNFYYLAAKEKPNPLSAEFSPAYFENLRKEIKPTLSAKAFLATQQRIPGLGNGVLQDILFQARIHPKRKMRTLCDAEMDGLYRSVKETLLSMTMNRGRDTEKDLFGCAGGYQTILSSKTLKNPCPVCAGELVREAYLGGNIYYCSTCQKKD